MMMVRIANSRFVGMVTSIPYSCVLGKRSISDGQQGPPGSSARAAAEAEDAAFYAALQKTEEVGDALVAEERNGFLAALGRLSSGIGVADVIMTPQQQAHLEALRAAHEARGGAPAQPNARRRPTARSGPAMGSTVVPRRGRLQHEDVSRLLEESRSLSATPSNLATQFAIPESTVKSILHYHAMDQ